MPQQTSYTIDAANGEPLHAIRYAPEPDDARGVVVIVPAMATHARHYEPLAAWFTQQGYVVHTFNYQGYGDSARTPLNEVTADILTWASDAARIVDHIAATEGEVPLHWVGHSLGGQLLPFVDHARLSSATLLCSGTGYWKLSEGRNRFLAPALWYAIAPVATRLFGYYPGRRLRLLGDLPAPVMTQWAHWCRQPDYMFDVHPEFRDRFAAVTTPIISVSVTDDDTMSAAATADLEARYIGAPLTATRYAPTDLDMTELGHLRIARPRGAQAWNTVFEHFLTHNQTRS